MISVVCQTFLVVITVTMVITKQCEILENMSCQCHTSSDNKTTKLRCMNYYISINKTIQIINKNLLHSYRFDSFHLTFHSREFNISAMFINQLSYLFPRSSSIKERKQKTIRIILTFQEYHRLNVEDYSFYRLFRENSEYATSLSLEFTSGGRLTFGSMAFYHLTVDQMSMYCSSFEPYSFEEIFNNTKIGSLSIEGNLKK